jgi:hypothetical protein
VATMIIRLVNRCYSPISMFLLSATLHRARQASTTASVQLEWYSLPIRSLLFMVSPLKSQTEDSSAVEREWVLIVRRTWGSPWKSFWVDPHSSANQHTYLCFHKYYNKLCAELFSHNKRKISAHITFHYSSISAHPVIAVLLFSLLHLISTPCALLHDVFCFLPRPSSKYSGSVSTDTQE